MWHPNTQMAEWDAFDEVVSARGMHLTVRGGRRLIDGVASMWCNVWGHSRPEIVAAIARQARRLQHSPLFNLTHGPAERLARGLVRSSPGMRAALFSDNGSTAVEAAIKIAVQYWANEGDGRRRRIASLRGGYHGDTAGAMSAGYSPGFFGRYRPLTFRARRFEAPRAGRTPGGESPREQSRRCLGLIDEGLSRDGTVAALVMESGAQVAGGVNVYPDGFQRGVSRLCRRHGVLLIADEVATGLGRLGSMAEYAAQGSRPDVVAYGKALTGGYLPMAATLASRRVYDAFSGRFGEGRHLFHGHTYSGNPVAAAAANASLALYRSERLLRRVARSSAAMGRMAGGALSRRGVAAVRHRGMLMGIELGRGRGGTGRGGESVNRIVFEEGRRRGVYLRTLGNVVTVVPPLAIPEGLLGRLVGRALDAAEAAYDRL